MPCPLRHFVPNLMLVGLVGALVAGAALAQDDSESVRPEFEPPAWIAGLPDVLLIGDSISIGYTLDVRDVMFGEANVFRPPVNCGPTTRGLEQLDQWLGESNWDVIHFNFGLHDLKYMGPDGKNLADPRDPQNRPQVPIEQYKQNLRKIVERLKQTNARLIWCETTPVPDGAKGRVPGDEIRYNEAAAEVMSAAGAVATNRLHEHAQQHAQQQPRNVHFTGEGSGALADKVIESIRNAINQAP